MRVLSEAYTEEDIRQRVTDTRNIFEALLDSCYILASCFEDTEGDKETNDKLSRYAAGYAREVKDLAADFEDDYEAFIKEKNVESDDELKEEPTEEETAEEEEVVEESLEGTRALNEEKRLVRPYYVVYAIDEAGDEIDQIKTFTTEKAARNFATKYPYSCHIVFVPDPSADEGEEYAEYIENNFPYYEFECVDTFEKGKYLEIEPGADTDEVQEEYIPYVYDLRKKDYVELSCPPDLESAKKCAKTFSILEGSFNAYVERKLPGKRSEICYKMQGDLEGYILTIYQDPGPTETTTVYTRLDGQGGGKINLKEGEYVVVDDRNGHIIVSDTTPYYDRAVGYAKSDTKRYGVPLSVKKVSNGKLVNPEEFQEALNRPLIKESRTVQEMRDDIDDLIDELDAVEGERNECYITWNFGEDPDGNLTGGVDIHPHPRYENDPEKIEELKAKVETIFRNHGFELDSAFKVNPGKTLFGAIHYQIKKNKDDFDGFFSNSDVTEGLEDTLRTVDFGEIKIVPNDKITKFDKFIKNDSVDEWSYYQTANGDVVATKNESLNKNLKEATMGSVEDFFKKMEGKSKAEAEKIVRQAKGNPNADKAYQKYLKSSKEVTEDLVDYDSFWDIAKADHKEAYSLYEDYINFLKRFDPFYIGFESTEEQEESWNTFLNDFEEGYVESYIEPLNWLEQHLTNESTRKRASELKKRFEKVYRTNFVGEGTEITEDTEKVKTGKWVNKGKEGTHGTFKTKKEADQQRKAMFARGFKG